MPTPLAKIAWQQPEATAHRSATTAQKKRIDRMGCSPAGNGAAVSDRISIVGDCVMPVQFYEEQSQSPEQSLLFAVLVRSYNDLTDYGSKMDNARGRRLYADAWAWFATNDPTWIYSFVSICAVIGLDPSAVRLGIRRHFSGDGKLPGSTAASIYLGKQKQLRTGAQVDEFMESRQGRKAA